ncbi:MAG: hypothetical protein IPM28_01065 [Chloracidobacterium sp.]|nr:hypothetical protein [Chloracidobacterium sp.]
MPTLIGILRKKRTHRVSKRGVKVKSGAAFCMTSGGCGLTRRGRSMTRQGRRLTA